MGFGDPLGNGKTKSRTRTVSGSGASEIGAVEAVEDVGQVGSADADSVIPTTNATASPDPQDQD
jgi:hypothetical protein